MSNPSTERGLYSNISSWGRTSFDGATQREFLTTGLVASSGFSTIYLSEIKHRRFNIIDKEWKRAKAEEVELIKNKRKIMNAILELKFK